MKSSLAEKIRADANRGIEDGLITMPSGQTVEESYDRDDFGQLHRKEDGSFDMRVRADNFRPLSEVARIMCHVHQKSASLGKNWLELGHGQGVAVSEASLHNMIVDSVGMSPIAPRIQPHLNLCESGAEMSAPMKFPKFHPDTGEIMRITMDMIDEVRSEILSRYFTEAEIPYVQRQFIGDLIHQNSLPPKKYNVAHDWFGPMHYSVRRNPKEALARVLESQRENGCLVIDPCMDIEIWEQSLLRSFPEWRGIHGLKEPYGNGPLIIFGKENPIEPLVQRGVKFTEISDIEMCMRKLWNIRIQDLLEEDAAVGNFGPSVRLQPNRDF